ncbi:hypothetical protein TPHA_0D00780 [Tetrapisispora phaffii CBS 4417]|uniref:NEDD8-activating enzyme E1 regulatory subunit n=1 Tax=Tetrapisispora phaffii (strain ATCC 24235 / CBS 4417 / NBRC 1672 / NRRL Y-8282 / UCD 70-5) TaxID=1071381 RepID=G8BSA0_TETPH|nr:hypothetical protein TPHA_0D00780 [Tetrapisispora phaffii CBS 4417]CCE62721.1 hypothetical protein TPHA_0D00780 [Tetrapisispora phaffii CBS 4417]
MEKFDRQIRLWGSKGQLLLESSNICIITNNTQTICVQEYLKNLLQLGINNIDLIKVNNTNTADDDIKIGFFDYHYENNKNNGNGNSVNELLVDNINELNLENYNVIILIDLIEIKTLNFFNNIKLNQPILSCYSKGLYGYLHLKVNEPHFIINKNLEFMKYDLKLYDENWLELKNYMDSIDLNIIELSQLPYVIILYKALYDLSNSKKIELNDIPLNQLKDHLSKFKPISKIVSNTDMNYLEAKRFAHLALRNKTFETHFIEQMNLIEEINPIDLFDPINQYGLTIQKLFYSYCISPESEHDMPLSGTLPDMESDNRLYNDIKTIYDKRSKRDSENFNNYVKNITHEIPDDFIDDFASNITQTDTFVSESNFTKMIELNTSYPTLILKELIGDQYYKNATSKVSSLKGFNLNSYPTTSIIAGIVAQETIKLITHQFEPIDNTIVYDGLNNNIEIYKI